MCYHRHALHTHLVQHPHGAAGHHGGEADGAHGGEDAVPLLRRDVPAAAREEDAEEAYVRSVGVVECVGGGLVLV